MARTAQDFDEHPFLAGDALRVGPGGAPRLIGSQCGDCGTKAFPPVHVCPGCMSESVRQAELASEGTLYSWSVVHVAPQEWKVPYVAGYVDLNDGVRVFAHIVGADPETLKMDMAVELTTAVLGEADGVAIESYAFTPKRA